MVKLIGSLLNLAYLMWKSLENRRLNPIFKIENGLTLDFEMNSGFGSWFWILNWFRGLSFDFEFRDRIWDFGDFSGFEFELCLWTWIWLWDLIRFWIWIVATKSDNAPGRCMGLPFRAWCRFILKKGSVIKDGSVGKNFWQQ